jgi:hypothetical protein
MLSRWVLLGPDGISIEADRVHLYGKVSCTVDDSGGDEKKDRKL